MDRFGRIVWSFTGRSGGVSVGDYSSLNLGDHVGDRPEAVAENRRRAAGTVGLPANRLAIMRAAHGAAVAAVDSPGIVDGVDVLVTRKAGLGLVAQAADCVPLVLGDSGAGVIAAVHCGWRGLLAGTVAAAVSEMIRQGAEAGSIVAALGPSICVSCYQVSADVRAQVGSVEPEAVGVSGRGEPAVNLAAGVGAQLRRAGIPEVRRDSRCSFESTDELFSYRRDRVTGRQGVVVALVAGEETAEPPAPDGLSTSGILPGSGSVFPGSGNTVDSGKSGT